MRDENSSSSRVERELQRSRSSLVISGTAVIAFGLWSVVKLVLSFLLLPDQYSDYLTSAGPGGGKGMMILILVIIGLFELGVHAYVGLCARSEGIKGKRRYFYLAVAVVMILFTAVSIVLSILYPGDSIVDLIIQILVDVTFIAALAELIRSSVVLKRLRRQEG